MKLGAVTVDLEHGKIWDDIKFCGRDSIIESARELIEIAPKGTKAIGKAYDNDCYIYGPSRLKKCLDNISKPSPCCQKGIVEFHYLGTHFVPYGYEQFVGYYFPGGSPDIIK